MMEREGNLARKQTKSKIKCNVFQKAKGLDYWGKALMLNKHAPISYDKGKAYGHLSST